MFLCITIALESCRSDHLFRGMHRRGVGVFNYEPNTITMKRFILVVCLALLSVGAYAQKGKYGAGIAAIYGSEISKVGVGVKGQYYFNDYIRGEVGLNIFAKNEGVSTWDADINFHYLANIAKNRLYLYPLAGVSFSLWKFDTITGNMGEVPDTESDAQYAQYEDTKEFRLGPNLGLGLQYNIKENTAIFVEGRYQMTGAFAQGVFGIGIQQRF